MNKDTAVIEIKKKGEFSQKVLQQNKLAIVDFWAEWCGPCQTLMPIFQQLADEYKSQAIFARVNVDENPLLASTYKVQSIPTVLFIKNSSVVNQQVGVLPKNDFKKIIDKLLSSAKKLKVIFCL